MTERWFPIQIGGRGSGERFDVKPFPPRVPWSVAELAFGIYLRDHYGSGTIERMAERGGFSAGEMDLFLPDWRERCSELAAVTAERDALRAAIVEHHAQKADDRCIEDDDRLYAAAGLPPCDRQVGDKAAMLANCARFIERRCEGGGWPTYVELEDALALAATEREALRRAFVDIRREVGTCVAEKSGHESAVVRLDWRFRNEWELIWKRALEVERSTVSKITTHRFVPCHMGAGCARKDHCHHVDPHQAEACGALVEEHAA